MAGRVGVGPAGRLHAVLGQGPSLPLNLVISGTNGGTYQVPARDLPNLHGRALRRVDRSRLARTRGAIVLADSRGSLYEAMAEETPDEYSVEAAALGFEIVKTVISPMWTGDVNYTGPTSTIGVRWPSAPARADTMENNKRLFSFTDVHVTGAVYVDVKLRAWVQYNGPEVEVTFTFDRKRSRMARDTTVDIGNPLSLKTKTASSAWQAAGVPVYPTIEIPISCRVDRPFPLSNWNLSFFLVLSGMYGFGPDASGTWWKSWNRYND
jgi:hypothetical protein